MFYIRSALINIKRYKSKSILNLLICTVVVILLNLYMGSLESNKHQLTNLAVTMPINAQISNLNGTLQTGLVINEPIVDAILQSEYITKPAITVVLSAGEGELPKENLRSNMTFDAVGITNIEAVSGISEKDVTLASSESDFTFLQSKAPNCIVEEGFLERNNWRIGQTITLYMYYDYIDRNTKYVMQQLKSEEFYIVGSVASKEGEYLPQVMVPFPWAREAFQEQNIPFIANAASFYIKNPLQINEFKKEMHEEVHMLEISTASDFAYNGNALAVNDETFILAASSIQDNISLLTGFLPFVLIIIVFIGYITSYLLIQNRRGQYAIMRSLGVSSRLCFFILFLESIIVELLGGTTGIFISVLLTKQKGWILILTFTIFMFCYICGASMALYLLGRVSVMKAMTQKD